MIKTSDEGTSYCTQCEAYAKELDLYKKLREAAQELVDGNYDPYKTDCVLCGAFLSNHAKGCEMPALYDALAALPKEGEKS